MSGVEIDEKMRVCLMSLNPAQNRLCRSLFREQSEKFLGDVLLPNLVWRAGRTAAALRTSALSCLLALLHGGGVAPQQVRTYVDDWIVPCTCPSEHVSGRCIYAARACAHTCCL